MILNAFVPAISVAFIQPSDFALQRITTALFTAFFVLSLTVTFYIFHPWRQSRAFGAAELLDNDSATAQRISELATKIGISPPRLLVDKNILHVDAIAFGFVGRRTVLLGRGLQLLRAKRPSEFDVRIAHELAHIKNRDIDFGYVAQAMVDATKVLMSLCLLAWCVTFIQSSLHTWTLWKPYLSLGYTWFYLAKLFGALSWHFITLNSLTLFWTLPIWAVLIVLEHRSFLRSREFYADIAACNSISVAALASAVRQRSLGGSNVFYELFSAHPTPNARLEVSSNPGTVIVPRPTYIMFFGYVCGTVEALVVHYGETLATAFPSMHVTYTNNYLEIMATQKWQFIYATFFMFVLLLPFVIAFGSLGIRACLSQLLSSASLAKNVGTFVVQGILFISFFLVGSIINPWVSLRVKFNFGMGNDWTLMNSWTDFIPHSPDLIMAFAIFAAYLITNLVFVTGLRGAVRGSSPIRPEFLWRLSLIILWIYVYMEAIQFVGYILNIGVGTPLVAPPLWYQQLFICLLLIVPVAVCWPLVWLISRFIGRRGTTNTSGKSSEFSPWLYFRAVSGNK